ncbi:hypothetical protein C5O22_11715 [Treponema sp. J25]|nr:hypothetical protein C5O22_11715 [Treponema sp. J25]
MGEKGDTITKTAEAPVRRGSSDNGVNLSGGDERRKGRKDFLCHKFEFIKKVIPPPFGSEKN